MSSEEDGDPEDLQWFHLETRLRALVLTLIDPLDRKLRQEVDVSLKTSMQMDAYKKKLDELEFLIHKSQKRTSDFDELAVRLSELEQSAKVQEQKQQQEQAKVFNAVEVMREGVRHVQRALDSYGARSEQVEGEVGRVRLLMGEARDAMMSQYNKVGMDMQTKMHTLQQQVNNVLDLKLVWDTQMTGQRRDMNMLMAQTQQQAREMTRRMEEMEELFGELREGVGAQMGQVVGQQN